MILVGPGRYEFYVPCLPADDFAIVSGPIAADPPVLFACDADSVKRYTWNPVDGVVFKFILRRRNEVRRFPTSTPQMIEKLEVAKRIGPRLEG